MGCVIVLLAAILCTMIFGPVPVLVVCGLALAYAAFLALAMGVGNAGAAIHRVWRSSRTTPPPSTKIEPRGVADARHFDEWAARNPIKAARAKAAQAAWDASEEAARAERAPPVRRREPVFTYGVTAYVVAAIIAAFAIAAWLDHYR